MAHFLLESFLGPFIEKDPDSCCFRPEGKGRKDDGDFFEQR